ncbi:unnamed protein product [Meganyctiphanes norvegica]|uniref:Uncharacterized protein n=1 Tax=Meganyctiphanes norvegica TaxID=48144 RepID=A0AAV2QM29_MEGNR
MKRRLEHAGSLAPAAKKAKILGLFTTKKSFTQPATIRPIHKKVHDAHKKAYSKVSHRNAHKNLTARRDKFGNKIISRNRKITDYFSIRKPSHETRKNVPLLQHHGTGNFCFTLQHQPINWKGKETDSNSDASKIVCKLCLGEFRYSSDLDAHARLCLIKIFLYSNITLPN